MKRVILVHDAVGKIVSVTHVPPGARHGVGVKPPAGHSIREIELEQETASLSEIRDHHVVDLSTGTLKKK